jgi:hypothetical protein
MSFRRVAVAEEARQDVEVDLVDQAALEERRAARTSARWPTG